MDPDFIRKQVRTVWRVVSANAELMQGRNLIIEGAAVQSDFVLGQVSVLYDAVADSVNLKANHVREHQFHIMKPEFLSYQGMALKAVMDDNARLQDTSQTTYAGLSSLNESFINSLVTNLHDIVSDNMTVAMQHQIQPNALYMSRPSCIARLTLAFRSVMSTYVLNRRCLADQEQKRIAAERALEHMKVQVELTSADKSAAIAKVAECETSTSALLQQHEQSQAAANAAQARARQLEEELTSLKDKHSLCNSVERCEAELSTLKLENTKLMQAYEEQREAISQAASRLEAISDEKRLIECERDTLAADLSRAHKAHETFILARVQVDERINAEMIRQDDVVQQKESATKRLQEEKTKLGVELEASKMELFQAQSQLAESLIQCDTWKAKLGEVLARQGSEAEEIRQNGVMKEREETDFLLQNAGKRIEMLELRLREKDTEICRLRDESARMPEPITGPALEPSGNATSFRPPAQQLLPSSITRKRPATEGTTGTWTSASHYGTHALDLAAHGSPLPLNRVRELATLPEVPVDLGPGQSGPAIFTRQSLSKIIGGSVQGLIVRCSESATALARSHNISCFLCPNMDHNAWSPPGPGKHGYMQVGLGRDKAYFNDGECRHVFVGAGKGFVYCGYYHALRVERLTKEEWATLPSKVRTTYAATTVLKEKTKELRSPQRVLAMYDAGELRAPCVRLQCIEFDTAFYQELVRANDQYFGRAIATSEPAKRRRVSQVDPEETDSDEDVIGTSAKAPAKRAGPNVAITAPPTPSVWPALNTGEITVQQYNVRDASMAIVPSINVNPSTQVPSQPQPPERTTRLSTRMASGTLILRIPGGRAVVQATESDFGGPGYDSVESSVDDDEDDLYVDDSD